MVYERQEAKQLPELETRVLQANVSVPIEIEIVKENQS